MSKEFFLKTRECLTRANYTSPKIKDLYIRCKSVGDEFCEDDLFEFLSELCDEVERLYVAEQDDSSEKIEELKDEICGLENELAEAREDIDELEDNNCCLKSDIEDLESKLSDAEDIIGDLESKISSLEDDIERLESKISSLLDEPL